MIDNPPAPAREHISERTRIENARKWWESEGRNPREGKLTEITRDELDDVLKAAENWEPNIEETATRKPARLAGYKLNAGDLKDALRGARLIEADLRWADLWEVRLDGANLWRARFHGAMLARATFERLEAPSPRGSALTINAELKGGELTGTITKTQKQTEDQQRDRRFQPTDLTDADFRDADLGDVRLESAVGLRAEKLAGTNLTNAKLPPDIMKFDRLAHVEKTSQSASTTFFGLLAASLYSWLTLATTRDVDLLTDRASSPLPIINTPISLAWFYWTAPLILLSVYLYLHLYLQRLWQDLSALPAVFPDGETIDEKAYPWLLNGLVRPHLFRLTLFARLKRINPRPLSRLEYGLTVVLAWGVIPVTLLAFLVAVLAPARLGHVAARVPGRARDGIRHLLLYRGGADTSGWAYGPEGPRPRFPGACSGRHRSTPAVHRAQCRRARCAAFANHRRSPRRRGLGQTVQLDGTATDGGHRDCSGEGC